MHTPRIVQNIKAGRSRPSPTLFVSSAKSVRKGATHHPACVTLRRCPPPYALACTGMISFAMPQHINKMPCAAPETCHLPLSTCNLKSGMVKTVPHIPQNTITQQNTPTETVGVTFFIIHKRGRPSHRTLCVLLKRGLLYTMHQPLHRLLSR